MASRLFVIDSNVLMHDPAALFRFQEHDLFVPMMVLEELDHNKKGRSEVARNARQVSRFIDEVMSNHEQSDIEDGLRLELTTPILNHMQESEHPVGRLFLQTRAYPNALPEYLPGNLPDNNILGTSLALKEKYPDRSITLVSKDINLRIKAAVVGIHAEDYHNDQVLEDVDLLYTGHTKLNDSFWETHSKEMDSWMEEGRTFYRLHGPEVSNWSVIQFLYSDKDDGFEAIVRSTQDDEATIETLKDYKSSNNVWGINARNREQNFALNLLLDPEVDFVTLIGTAGTGKTLLTLAAGLEQTLEKKILWSYFKSDKKEFVLMTGAFMSVG